MTVSPQLSGFNTQDSQLTLQRLADGVRLRQAATLIQPTTSPTLADEPTVTDPPVSRPADQTDFERLDEAFKGLGPLVRRLKATAARYEFQTEEVRDSAIERAIRPFTESRGGHFPGGITADLDSALVDKIALKGHGFRSGEEIELTLTQTEQAELASLFLELGADPTNGISLGGAGGTFTIEIAGAGGTQSLSFGSGQTLSQIAAAIASFSEATGVQAIASGSGLILSSTSYGSGVFTTVKIVDDAGIIDNGSGNTLGIYQLDENGEAQDSGSTFTSTSASIGVSDAGQDAVVEINGVAAEKIGDYWVASLGKLDVAVDLNEEALAAAGDGPIGLGTVGKPEHENHGHHGHHGVKGDRGHRGDHRGRGVRERDGEDDGDDRVSTDQTGGGLLPRPEDEVALTKIAQPRLDLDVLG